MNRRGFLGKITGAIAAAVLAAHMELGSLLPVPARIVDVKPLYRISAVVKVGKAGEWKNVVLCETDDLSNLTIPLPSTPPGTETTYNIYTEEISYDDIRIRKICSL